MALGSSSEMAVVTYGAAEAHRQERGRRPASAAAAVYQYYDFCLRVVLFDAFLLCIAVSLVGLHKSSWHTEHDAPAYADASVRLDAKPCQGLPSF